jgi:hypothetical protein
MSINARILKSNQSIDLKLIHVITLKFSWKLIKAFKSIIKLLNSHEALETSLQEFLIPIIIPQVISFLTGL